MGRNGGVGRVSGIRPGFDPDSTGPLLVGSLWHISLQGVIKGGDGNERADFKIAGFFWRIPLGAIKRALLWCISGVLFYEHSHVYIRDIDNGRRKNSDESNRTSSTSSNEICTSCHLT